MPMMTYSARDQEGKLVRGNAEARTKEELIRSLQARAFIVVSVEETRKGSKPAQVRHRLRRGVRLDDVTVFARQLAVLLESGTPILKAVDILSQQVSSAPLCKACKQIEEDLKAGNSLKDAISKYPKIFSQIWVDLIETGEATGQLAFVLRQLADYLENVRAIQRRVVSALIYPLVLLAVSMIAIFVFVYRVIPIFSVIYKGFSGELPLLTRAVIAFSEFTQRNAFSGVMLLLFTGFFLYRYINTENGKRRFDSFKLGLPVIGDLFRSIAIERFAASLAILVKGGISIVHAIEVAGRAAANKVIEDAIDKVKLSVIQGKPISVQMAATGIFPPLVTQMINVGEESGRLAQLLDEVSKFYSEEVSTKVTRLVNLFEPALLVIMGCVIGTLVVAMYLPIFKMASLVGGRG